MSKRTGRLVTATLAAGLVLSVGSAALAAAPVGALKQFKVPTANSDPRSITNGSDGNVWFTEGNDLTGSPAKIGRITPGGAITEFAPTETDGCGSCQIIDLAQGPGDILYITSNGSNLMRFNVSTLRFESPVPIAETGAFNNVAVGAGNVWITDFNTHVVWRYNITTGAIDAFAAQTPLDVAVDAAGNAWFTENHINDNGTSNIGRIGVNASPSDLDAVTRIEIPAPARSITVTPGLTGKVWFGEGLPDQFVGFIDRAANDDVTVFPVTGTPADIAVASDGTVWFTQEDKGNIANITEAGVITEGKVVKGSQPAFITVALNGNPWYTMMEANKIATLQLR